MQTGRIERGGPQSVVLVPTHPAGVIASVAYTETVFDRETSVDHRAAGRGLCPEADLSPSPIGWVCRGGSTPARRSPPGADHRLVGLPGRPAGSLLGRGDRAGGETGAHRRSLYRASPVSFPLWGGQAAHGRGLRRRTWAGFEAEPCLWRQPRRHRSAAIGRAPDRRQPDPRDGTHRPTRRLAGCQVEVSRMDHSSMKQSSILRVTEIFHSIQGESSYAGLPCVFVRLTGCALRCVWCDSEFSFYEGTRQSIEEVLQQVRSHGLPLVEITGGEPLLQPGVHPLIRALLDEGRTVLIETGGDQDISRADPRAVVIMDIKCPGSGM